MQLKIKLIVLQEKRKIKANKQKLYEKGIFLAAITENVNKISLNAKNIYCMLKEQSRVLDFVIP